MAGWGLTDCRDTAGANDDLKNNFLGGDFQQEVTSKMLLQGGMSGDYTGGTLSVAKCSEGVTYSNVLG